ncbi:MAG: DUF4080 domain-containing protein [Sulfurospirillum sp.]|nr:DUF4080 domain-containing protein [Sulfurospirillum sp.]
MSDIVLGTFNAKYIHVSIGLRYIFANLKELKNRTVIKEFVVNSQVRDAVEVILKENPKIVGIGTYIWNANEVAEFVEIIKKVAPHIIIILGGPEVSYTPHRVDFSGANYFIQGEGDNAFYELCRSILDDDAPKEKIIKAKRVNLNEIELPYKYFNNEDISHRQCYVEASRGCPYLCEFCLSSLDKKVREIDIDKFLKEIEILWNKGVRSFKFIDRTFNQNVTTANKLMDFFLLKEPPYFIHFEVIPDNFPESIKQRIKKFPPSSLQLEIGIQTLDKKISKNIYRKLNLKKIKENLEFLDNETKSHLHVDLIIGLPGESIEQFGKNLDLLYSMTKGEIQLGVLKKLSGTTMSRHDKKHGMIYSNKPPYEILQNTLITFEMMQKMKRFTRFWDMVYNSGNFKKSILYIFKSSKVYDNFFAFSNWIYTQTESTWKISLDRLSHLIFRYVTEVLHIDEEEFKRVLIDDISTPTRRRLPKFLIVEIENKRVTKKSNIFNKRQIKHLE